ncbi:MAG: peroxiredoxin [Candidatus Methanomethylophilaceae archaeon]|nr:thioredoxin-dependent peroxiredoxin [Candidatus Methanomethylophilaceae archaeon]
MEIGEKFPDFLLADENGEMFDSKALAGVRYVIYFYPKDNTAGCTREAVDFSGHVVNFMLRNIAVIGVSRDSPATHRKFIDKNGLKIKLLSDPEHTLTEAVGAWAKKVMYGKETEGVIRSTFIVGKDGKIEAAWKKVKVDGHAQEVLDRAVSLAKTP